MCNLLRTMITNIRFQQLKLLLWKNVIWHRHYWWWTLLEILSRSFLSIFVAFSMAQQRINKPTWKGETIFSAKPLLWLFENTFSNYDYVAYTPTTPFTDRLMENVVQSLNSIGDKINASHQIELVKMATEDDLVVYTVNRTAASVQVAFPLQRLGIVFREVVPNRVEAPDKLIYELRIAQYADVKNTHAYSGIFVRSSIVGNKNAPPESAHYYWNFGTGGIQWVVNEEYVRLKVNSSSWSASQPSFQLFPHPRYDENRQIHSLSLLVFFALFVALESALAISFLTSVINEKNNSSKDIMKVYGVEEWIIWLSWFVEKFAITFLSITLMVICFYLPVNGPRSEVINYTSFSIMWIIFLLYATSNITFSLFMAAIFNKAVIASFSLMVFVFSAYILTFILSNSVRVYQDIILFYLLPLANFRKAIYIIRFPELLRVNVTLTSINQLRDFKTDLSLSFFLIMFVVNIILYSYLAISINQGTFGNLGLSISALKALLSPNEKETSDVQKESQQKIPHSKIDEKNKKSVQLVSKIQESEDLIELSSSAKVYRPLLRIQELHKKYGAKHVLKGIDMDIYQNEVNLIIGHKGSGKSTLFSILIGSIPCDSGTIYYRDTDITSNMNVLKNNLEVGFQIDGLLHHLSVKENLMFYGMLKKLSKNEADDEADILLAKMGLQQDEGSSVLKLPEIMKKKLNIAATLIGEREILLLDEPMVGLDAQSKVDVWNLLLDLRTHHTIILSSNYEIEAEQLADRVTFLENGVVIAHGNRAELKDQFGNGYEISILGKPLNSEQIIDKVNENVKATIERQSDEEILFKVPFSESPKFQSLFENIEQEISTLGISTVNLTFNTTQHILMKNGSLSGHRAVVSPQIVEILGRKPSNATGGFFLRLRQMKMLFAKKLLYVVRDYNRIFLRIVIPSLILLLLAGLIEIYDFNPYHAMKMSPSQHINSKFMIYSDNSSQSLMKLFENHINSEGGFVWVLKKRNIVRGLIEIAEKDILAYRLDFVAAFKLEKMQVINVLYNVWATYSLPIAINTYFNVLLRNATNDESMEIITYNHPMPFLDPICTITDLDSDYFCYQCSTEEMIFRVFLYLVFLYIIFGYVSNEIILYLFEITNKEIANGLMHLEIISGVPKWMYWLTTFVFDYSFFIIVVAFQVVLFKVFDNFINFFTFDAAFVPFVLLMPIFGMTGLFCCYIICPIYNPAKRTYAHSFGFNISCNLFGLVLYVMRENHVYFKDAFRWKDGTPPLFETVLYLPFINHLYVMQTYLWNWYRSNECFVSCLPVIKWYCLKLATPASFFEYQSIENPMGMRWELTCLIIPLIYCGILFIFMNLGIVDLLQNIFKKTWPQDQNENDTVIQERKEIQRIKEDKLRYKEVPFMVDGLGKKFMKWFRPVSVVNDVSFIAQSGTCFGILGPPDAGKTTTYCMMTCEMVPTVGDISIKGVSMRGNKKQYFSLIGCYPRTFPLIDKFTGREMFILMATLKGIDGNIYSVVDELISAIGLEDVQHSKCESYTEGSKRVLGTALTLVGNPKVIFLNETTADIDSLSRRHVYDIIEKVKNTDKVLILTSKSPNECEIICDRVTILVNGVMHCIGNPRDLSQLFGRGYFIIIKIHPESTFLLDAIKLQKDLVKEFGLEYSRRIEWYKGLLHYQIADDSLTLSVVFQKMEDLKKHHSVIEEYTVSICTLRHIFNSLTSSKELFDT